MLRRTVVSLALATSSVVLSGNAAHALQATQPDVVIPMPATAPNTKPAPQTEKLQATVTGVEGIVQVRTGEDQPWQRATKGMVLDENAEFRTGPRSAVQFALPPDQVITLDRLGVVKLLQAVNDHGKIKTNLGMRYGRTRYDIEAAGREHESTISSPSSTLAVRGTRFSSYDQRPFPAEAVSLTGRVEFRDARKRIKFGGPGAGKLKVNENAKGAADASLAQSYVDPASALARTPSESSLIATLLSRGATMNYDYEKGIKVITGGTHPTTDKELIPVLPGTLNFVLRWEGNADLNLAVLSTGEDGVRNRMYPIGGLNVSPNGGRTDFDHRGGPNGGMEIAYWPKEAPAGIYTIGSQHMSGKPTPATLDVFEGSQRVGVINSGGMQTTVNFISEPITTNGVEGQALGILRRTTPGRSVQSFEAPKKTSKPAAVPAAVKVRRAR